MEYKNVVAELNEGIQLLRATNIEVGIQKLNSAKLR